ncbi:ankyrin repeat and KH domain-containing protein 1-like [Microplitis mediator]|uniref:ankyrin repeat and KH domain-containing protein 1-like n=1 Tax=Microplitis mediator TaxID=375433 RepID=UPI002553358F|nr:ankyrin repeat and KH domain-containing protein 1-like [Microplitis mediator]
MDKEIASAVTSGDLTAIERIFKNGADLNARIDSVTLIYLAIKAKKFDAVELLLRLGARVDDFVQLTGSLTKYTALHIACLENDRDLTRLLVIEYDANVHAVADDIQPIALAALLGHVHIVRILLDNGANPDATISKSIYTKYVKDVMWCSDFGDKMSLLTYAILNNQHDLATLLLKYDVSVKVKSLTNKTLLMYAVKNYRTVREISKSIIDKLSPEEINARDDGDFSVMHYLMHDLLCVTYLNVNPSDNYTFIMLEVLDSLISRGFDFEGTMNANPKDFLVNMAAANHCDYILVFLLLYGVSISKSKALYNALKPEASKYCYFPDCPGNDLSRISKGYWNPHRIQTQDNILKDLLSRQYFHDPTVPKQEIELMDEVIKEDKTWVKAYLEGYKKELLNLKDYFIHLSNKRMSFYDFLMLTNKELENLVRVENFTHVLSAKKLAWTNPGMLFGRRIKALIRQAQKRVKLLNQGKKIRFPTTNCLSQLPCEIILEIIEYLDVKELELFILAFQS